MKGTRLETFLNLIRRLNGGTVIPRIADEQSEISLPSDKIALFYQQLPAGVKYFFFADLGKPEDIETTLCEVEDTTIHKREQWCEGIQIKPSDSYMVYFWEVPEIGESVNRNVINQEENEFFYKKYVFYYTKQELDSCSSWISNHQKEIEDQGFLQVMANSNLDTPAMKYLTRFLIKLPCVVLPFQTQALPDFEELVRKGIGGIHSREKKDKIEEMNGFILKKLSEGMAEEDIASLIEKEMER